MQFAQFHIAMCHDSTKIYPHHFCQWSVQGACKEAPSKEMLAKAGVTLREPLQPSQCLVLLRSARRAIDAGPLPTAILVESLYFKQMDYPQGAAGVAVGDNTAYVLNCTFDGGNDTVSVMDVNGANAYVEGVTLVVSLTTVHTTASLQCPGNCAGRQIFGREVWSPYRRIPQISWDLLVQDSVLLVSEVKVQSAVTSELVRTGCMSLQGTVCIFVCTVARLFIELYGKLHHLGLSFLGKPPEIALRFSAYFSHKWWTQVVQQLAPLRWIAQMCICRKACLRWRARLFHVKSFLWWAGSVFSSSTLRIDMFNGQSYFKDCTVKTVSSGQITVSSDSFSGTLPRSPLQLTVSPANGESKAPFAAVALENMSFNLPKNLPPILIQRNAKPGETADAHVYSDAPVRVFLYVLDTDPKNSAVFKVSGNLETASADTPLNRPFLSADDALLKQYQAESVCLLDLPIICYFENCWIEW
jgi:hypothetical protein